MPSSPVKLLPFEHRWLMSLLEVIVPSGTNDRLPLGARDVPVEQFLDDAYTATPLDFKLGFRVCLWVVMFSPLFLLRRFKLAAGLTREERLALLERFAASDIYLVREMPVMFKVVLGFAYCRVPAVQRALGVKPLRAKRELITDLTSPQPAPESGVAARIPDFDIPSVGSIQSPVAERLGGAA
jgi:hypothetical protein